MELPAASNKPTKNKKKKKVDEVPRFGGAGHRSSVAISKRNPLDVAVSSLESLNMKRLTFNQSVNVSKSLSSVSNSLTRHLRADQ